MHSGMVGTGVTDLEASRSGYQPTCKVSSISEYKNCVPFWVKKVSIGKREPHQLSWETARKVRISSYTTLRHSYVSITSSTYVFRNLLLST